MEFVGSLSKNLTLVPTQSQINPIHTLPSYYPKIHFKIIFPCMPRSSKCLFPVAFLPELYVLFSCLPCVLHVPPISCTLIWYGEEHKLLTSSLRFILQTLTLAIYRYFFYKTALQLQNWYNLYLVIFWVSAFIFRVKVPLKCWYPPTRLQCHKLEMNPII
jgi:hypothetical protein